MTTRTALWYREMAEQQLKGRVSPGDLTYAQVYATLAVAKGLEELGPPVVIGGKATNSMTTCSLHGTSLGMECVWCSVT